jgi:protein-tyrosine kinase
MNASVQTVHLRQAVLENENSIPSVQAKTGNVNNITTAGQPIMDVAPTLICALTNSGPFATEILNLRTYLQINWLSQQPSTPRTALTLMSANRYDGRSVTLANLAITFAQMGLRTLLIDADLRNPSQDRLLKLERGKLGLSDTLRCGQNSIDQAQSVRGLSKLHVLCAGTSCASPHDLFAGKGFGELIGKALASYELVLIDCPSSAQAPEAVLIGKHAGAALIIARDGKTGQAEFDRLQNKTEINHVNIMGCLFVG